VAQTPKTNFCTYCDASVSPRAKVCTTCNRRQPLSAQEKATLYKVLLVLATAVAISAPLLLEASEYLAENAAVSEASVRARLCNRSSDFPDNILRKQIEKLHKSGMSWERSGAQQAREIC
jgi:hypothetical protein